MPIRPRSVRKLPAAQADHELAAALVVVGVRQFAPKLIALLDGTAGAATGATPREIAARMGVNVHTDSVVTTPARCTSVAFSAEHPSVTISSGRGFDAALVSALALLLVVRALHPFIPADPFRDETILRARTELAQRMTAALALADEPEGAVVIQFPMRQPAGSAVAR